MSGPTTFASLACLLVTSRPIVSPPFGPSVLGVHVGAAVEEHSRHVGAIGRQRRTLPIEAAPIRIPRHVMQQRRAREVVVRRFEVRARLDQRGIRRDETAQSLDVTRIHGVDGLVEARVRTERRDGVRQLDVVLQPGPGVETIFARDDQLGIGERQRRGKNGLGRLAP